MLEHEQLFSCAQGGSNWLNKIHATACIRLKIFKKTTHAPEKSIIIELNFPHTCCFSFIFLKKQ